MEIGVSLEQAREVFARLLPGDGLAVLPVVCGLCGRQTDVVCTVGTAPR
jgi:hypothetical protein